MEPEWRGERQPRGRGSFRGARGRRGNGRAPRFADNTRPPANPLATQPTTAGANPMTNTQVDSSQLSSGGDTANLPPIDWPAIAVNHANYQQVPKYDPDGFGPPPKAQKAAEFQARLAAEKTGQKARGEGAIQYWLVDSPGGDNPAVSMPAMSVSKVLVEVEEEAEIDNGSKLDDPLAFDLLPDFAEALPLRTGPKS